MPAVIVNWMDTLSFQDIGIVVKEDGTPMIFDDERSAESYAEENLNGEWYVLPV